MTRLASPTRLRFAHPFLNHRFADTAPNPVQNKRRRFGPIVERAGEPPVGREQRRLNATLRDNRRPSIL